MNKKLQIINYLYIVLGILIYTAYFLCLPSPLFDSPCSTVINDRNGNLLGASIAGDGQWRFPQMDSVPDKFKIASKYYEDEYFNYHPGFNLFSMLRAAYQNIKAGRIISGGSTITMQVIRLSRHGQSRTVLEKIIEILLSTRLELGYSKNEIFALYTSHAPFGGNIVGLDAAAWRYFGRKPEMLSWGEAAMLAVLPNQPSLIYPGKNQKILKTKRDKLLDKLYRKGKIDRLTAELAKSEPLPGAPYPLPNYAPHLLARSIKEKHKGERITTTIDYVLQQNLLNIIDNHFQLLRCNEIYNAAALILDVETGDALAYVGNTNIEDGSEHGTYVDVITAQRSTGSILKPFLYAAMLNEGVILRKTLVPDIPTLISGFAPKNFIDDYDGAVPADKALFRSLNVPAVYNLQKFGIDKFHYKLKQLGLKTLSKPPSHYGLSLILGGAETTLWDLTGAYASLARTLGNFYKYSGMKHYDKRDIHPANYIYSENNKIIYGKGKAQNSILSAASIWQTFNTLLESYRPETESSWEMFYSSQNIAWKTGTSFGFRDAWAVGITPKYVVGVWVGNADGEGRPGLTGLKAAAPILFDIFDGLQYSEWFKPPFEELYKIPVCRKSGERASSLCQEVDTIYVTEAGLKSRACPFCMLVHLDKTGKYRVNSSCESIDAIKNEVRFVLPPAQEWYYKMKNLSYEGLPPYRPDCLESQQIRSMQIIYPQENSKIYVPRELGGELGKTVFQAAHRRPEAAIYWHIDEQYIGTTRQIHQLALSPSEGSHILTLVDDTGEMIQRRFTIIGKK